ncbi:MAG: nuclear transport factor 2 family protein [Ilumatobacteraceae bacterium]
MRCNWSQIFRFVPDIRAEIVRSAIDGETAWTEWEMTGTRPDGSEHHMCGVIVFEVADAMINAARLYLEPVDVDSGDVAAAVSAQVER